MIPIEGSRAMAAALAQAQVPVTFVEVEGNHHSRQYEAMSSPDLPAGHSVLDASVDFLREWLDKERSEPTTGPADEGGGGTDVATLLVGGALVLILGIAGAGLGRSMLRRRRRNQLVREWKETAYYRRRRSNRGVRRR
jgi:hypothetical protein